MNNGALSVESNGEDIDRLDFGDHSSVDALLAHELNQLSVTERDQLNEEIHGVLDQSQNETPELLKTSLEQMAFELASIPASPSNEAYRASLRFPKSYVHTDDFHLIFLRCDFFDAKSAAERLQYYLEQIHWCFGDKVLQRTIRLSDFDEKSLKFFRAGYQQVLPGFDRTGRRIAGNFAFKVNGLKSEVALKCRVRIYIKLARLLWQRANRRRKIRLLPTDSQSSRSIPSFFFIRCCLHHDLCNQAASVLYLTTQLAKSVSVQRRGVVGIFWTLGFFFDDMKDRAEAHRRILPAMPIRLSAIHLCVAESMPEYLLNMLRTTYLTVIGRDNRIRLRIHQGML